jgi:hypothetical protein
MDKINGKPIIKDRTTEELGKEIAAYIIENHIKSSDIPKRIIEILQGVGIDIRVAEIRSELDGIGIKKLKMDDEILLAENGGVK